jgi:hypothetical protein
MATIKWATPASAENVLTTELNSIANNAGAITGTAVSNDASGELYLYADLELYGGARVGDQRGKRRDLYPRRAGWLEFWVWIGAVKTSGCGALVGVFNSTRRQMRGTCT